jgi:hypothetical protein
MQSQLIHSSIYCFKETDSCFGIAFVNLLKIAKRIQFGAVADKNLNRVQAAMERR